MIKLYQFPISHYCEKIRWALDYKKLPYQCVNLLPGLHIKKITSIAKTSNVPVLQHDDKVVQNSRYIIDYLDDSFKNNNLTPSDESEEKRAREWERFADQEIGPHLRCFFYHTLLEYPDLLIPLFSHQGPWYGKFVLRFFFPMLRKKMRKLLNINAQSAAEAKIKVKRAIDKVNERLMDRAYLAGNEFSRADLAVAALLAPLVQPAQYNVPWPTPLPNELKSVVDEWSDDLKWVVEMYNKHR